LPMKARVELHNTPSSETSVDGTPDLSRPSSARVIAGVTYENSCDGPNPFPYNSENIPQSSLQRQVNSKIASISNGALKLSFRAAGSGRSDIPIERPLNHWAMPRSYPSAPTTNLNSNRTKLTTSLSSS
jgi:hypothetical protein